MSGTTSEHFHGSLVIIDLAVSKSVCLPVLHRCDVHEQKMGKLCYGRDGIISRAHGTACVSTPLHFITKHDRRHANLCTTYECLNSWPNSCMPALRVHG